MTVLENGDLGRYAKRRVNADLTSGGSIGRSLCDRDALAVRTPLIRRPGVPDLRLAHKVEPGPSPALRPPEIKKCVRLTSFLLSADHMCPLRISHMRSRQKIKTRNEVFSARGLPSLSRRRSSGAGDVHVISKHLNGRRFEVVWNASVPINGLAKVRESNQPNVR